MNNGKEKKKEKTKEEYKVNYFFNENSKTNLNEIFKRSFLLSEIADEKVDLKSLGIRGTDKQKIIDMLYLCYNLNDNT